VRRRRTWGRPRRRSLRLGRQAWLVRRTLVLYSRIKTRTTKFYITGRRAIRCTCRVGHNDSERARCRRAAHLAPPSSATSPKHSTGRSTVHVFEQIPVSPAAAG